MTDQKTTETLSFEELFSIIKHKIATKEKSSYSNSLIEAGLEKINRKVGEEALEVVIAAFMNEQEKTAKRREELVGEICDLYYHSLILMASQNIEMAEIFAEFAKRNNKKK